MRMFGQLSAGGDLHADTPPHTPPNNNLKNGAPGAGQGHHLAGLMGGMFNGAGYNGLHNGYTAAAASALAQQQQQHGDASKLLGLNSAAASMNRGSSFKMM